MDRLLTRCVDAINIKYILFCFNVFFILLLYKYFACKNVFHDREKGISNSRFAFIFNTFWEFLNTMRILHINDFFLYNLNISLERQLNFFLCFFFKSQITIS